MHKDPHVHLYMIEVARRNGFTFDTVQMPLNVMDAHFRSFEKLVLPEASRLGMGVLGMKSMGNGVILKSGVVRPVECLQYALGLPVSVVITGIDSMQLLDQGLEPARTLDSAGDVAALLAKTARPASSGKFELFKTTQHFDSTAEHPEWLGPETEPVKELASV